MDVSDPGSVRAGLAGIDGSIDAVVMNAGGMGGKTPMKLTSDGATYMFAQNVLGHVVLLEKLLAEDRLGEVAVFAGSEAARGIPKMGFKRPSFGSNSADELAAVIDGSYFAGKPDVNLAYGQAKLMGVLWMAYLARQNPDRRFISMSPGNTTGTQAPNDLKLPLRLAAKYVMPRLGIAHKLDVGAKRLVDGVTDPTLSSGVFYASAANNPQGSRGRPSGHLPRPGQPVIPGPRQRGHPSLHHLKLLRHRKPEGLTSFRATRHAIAGGLGLKLVLMGPATLCNGRCSKSKRPRVSRAFSIAGAGFEPATFGL